MLWAYDIECEKWDRLVLGAAVSECGDVCTWYDERGFREWYERTTDRDIAIAHNGGRYDALCLIDACGVDIEWSAAVAGSSIIRLQAPGHAECRDSFRLFAISLKDWTGAKAALDLPCICGEKCGGYCSISRRMPRAQKQRLLDYCVQDCRALLRAYQTDIGALEESGFSVYDRRGLPRLTIGAVSWHTAKALAGYNEPLDVDPWEAWHVHDHGREAYYGGRTEVFRTRVEAGFRYDIHSAYPWALTLPVPHGQSKLIASGRRAFDGELPGIFRADVLIPDSRIPPLAHRGRNGSLLWATGHVSGVWTGIELRRSLDSGVRIVRLRDARIWPEESPIFRPYMEHVYSLRVKAKAAHDKRWDAVLKLCMNSLSGKLAQRPEVTTIRLTDEPLSDAGWLGPLGRAGRMWIQVTRRLAPCARPQMAAVLTSRVRGVLLSRLERADFGAVYCDTDSVYCVRPDDTDVTDNELGTWGFDGVMSDWLSGGPKVYAYNAHGSRYAKAKGVPKASPDDVRTLATGDGTVRRVSGVRGLTGALRAGERAFVARELSRTRRAPVAVVGTRYVLPDGSTVPLRREASGRYVWPGIDASPSDAKTVRERLDSGGLAD